MEEFEKGDTVKDLAGNTGKITCVTEFGVTVKTGDCTLFYPVPYDLELIPDTPSWLPLEVGKEYTLRNGKRYDCLSLNSKRADINHPVIGEWAEQDYDWTVINHA